MTRAERRRRDRQGKKDYPWDKIIVALVLLFFGVSAGIAYFFPFITIRSYAEGSPRIHRIIISRAVAHLKRLESINYTYEFTNKAGSMIHFTAVETGEVVTLTGPLHTEPTEYTKDTLPEHFQDLCKSLDELLAALQDRDFVIAHRVNEQQFGHQILQVIKRDDAGQAIEGYELFFDASHTLDELHFVRRVADNQFVRRVYRGLVAGGQ